jgi:hypothetical protein
MPVFYITLHGIISHHTIASLHVAPHVRLYTQMVTSDIVQVAHVVIIPLGACLVPCGAMLTTGGNRGLLQLGATNSSAIIHTHWQHHAFEVACSKRVDPANALRMGSSKLSSARKSCARESMEFLAGIISLELTAVFNIMG